MARGQLFINGRGEPQLLLDDGRKVEIEGERSPSGAAFVLLIDCSGSMSDKIVQAREGAMDFVKRALGESASVGVVTFDSHAKLLAEPSLDLPTISRAIAEARIAGSTNMADGITLAERILGEHSPRTIVLVTDGRPDDRDKALEASESARIRDVNIYCIGVDGADQEFLRIIATTEEMAKKVSAKDLHAALFAAADTLLLGGKY